MTPEQYARVQTDKVDYIWPQFVDIHGTPRAEGPARALDLFLEGSAGFAGAAVLGWARAPRSYMIAMPDLGSYTLVPWETGVARFACNITVTGRPGPTAQDRPPAHGRRAPQGGVRDDGRRGG
jgi:glutamine synthetase